MSETPQPGRQGRSLWDVLPDTARALNDTADGFGCVLALLALAIVSCTVMVVVEVLRP
jgi:uncharacterized OsmC-like protein